MTYLERDPEQFVDDNSALLSIIYSIRVDKPAAFKNQRMQATPSGFCQLSIEATPKEQCSTAVQTLPQTATGTFESGRRATEHADGPDIGAAEGTYLVVSHSETEPCQSQVHG